MNNITNLQITDTKENLKNDSNNNLKEQIVINYLGNLKNPFATLSAKDVSKDLHIGINQAYDLFKQKDFPTIKIGRRKTITLASYLLWKLDKKGVD